MVITLEELKQSVGIAPSDSSQDAMLTRMIGKATAFVESATNRRFQEPTPRAEYRLNYEYNRIILAGHVDDSPEADDPLASIDPTTSVRLFRRSRLEPISGWSELTESTDWERREDEIIFLRPLVNPACDEVRINYRDGYAVAPLDIQELVLEIATSLYARAISTATNSAGIKSETLGDYSYTLDLTQPGLPGGKLSEQAAATIERYKLLYV